MGARDFGIIRALIILYPFYISLYNMSSCVKDLFCTEGRFSGLHMHLQYTSSCLRTFGSGESSKVCTVSMSLWSMVIVVGGSSSNMVFTNSCPFGSKSWSLNVVSTSNDRQSACFNTFYILDVSVLPFRNFSIGF